MKNLETSFKIYLRKVGKIGEIPLGSHKPTEQDNQFLLQELKKLRGPNSFLTVSAVVMLFILFGIGVFVVFYFRTNFTTTGTLLGGTFLFLLAIVGKIRQFWLEKFILDYASIVLQKFSPEQAAEFILQLYNSFVGKKPKDQKES